MSKPYKKLVIVNSVSTWIKKHKDPEKTYSGMATYEKINREFIYIKDLFKIPIFIISIDYKNHINL